MNAALFDGSIGQHKIKNSYFEMWYIVFDNEVFLDKLEIDPMYRGQGHGTTLMQRFISEMDKPIRLEILSNDPLKFYLRLGFEITEVRSIDMGDICEATLVYTP